MLGANPANAATSLLYTGEMYDSSASMYYLRARWYDQQTGRFNRMDPFAGSTQDPQSLHKYLYCHANPINGLDASGCFTKQEVCVAMTITGLIVMGIGAVLFGLGLGFQNDFVRDVGVYTFITGAALAVCGILLGAGYGVIGAKFFAASLISLPLDVMGAYLAYLAGRNAMRLLHRSDLKAFIDYYTKVLYLGEPIPTKGAIVWRDRVPLLYTEIPLFGAEPPELRRDEIVLKYDFLPAGTDVNFRVEKFEVVDDNGTLESVWESQEQVDLDVNVKFYDPVASYPWAERHWTTVEDRR